MNLFVIIALFAVLVIIGIAALVVIGGMRKKGRLERALNMTLLLVRVPREYIERRDEGAQKMRELVTISEQVFASFSTLHTKGWNQFLYGEPYLSLEIAIHNVGEETYFYIAVPKSSQDVIEKQIYSYYPSCDISQVKEYSIFNSQGAVAAASMKYTANDILPFKTYQKLESDPVGTILTAMSNIKAEGQGAAFQIIIRPSHDKERKSFAAKVVREMQNGYQFKDAVGRVTSPPKPKKPDPNNPPEPERSRTISPADEEVIKAISAKATKTSFDTNIRLIASATTQFEADQILNEFISASLPFATVDMNSLKAEKVEGKQLDKLMYNYIYRLFDEKQQSILSTEEIASLYHFPTPLTNAPRVSFLKAKPAEPPSDLPKEGLVIANSYYRGEEKPIRITAEDRTRHVYIIGQTGTGKSSIMKLWIKQDLENGEGLAILDPAGEFAEFALSLIPKNRVEDVIYFDPSDLERPIGLNMFEIDPDKPEQKALVINELFSILDRLYDLKTTGGPMFEKYFRNACLLLLDDYKHEVPVLADISRVLTDDDYRADKLSRETNPLVVQFWTQEAQKAGGESSLANMAPYISTKVDVFISNEFLRPILNQSTTAFNFRDIMDNKKILICNLSKGKIGELNAKLMGSLIVSKLAVAAFSRADTPEDQLKPFYLYMDEFQNFAVDAIKTVLSEARKYKLCLTLAHQYIKQLPEDIKDAVFGNVGSMIFLRVSAEDAILESVKTIFDPIFTPSDLSTVDKLNGYVKLQIAGQGRRPFNIRFKYILMGPREMLEAVKEISRLKYGRPKDEVDEELREKFKNVKA